MFLFCTFSFSLYSTDLSPFHRDSNFSLNPKSIYIVYFTLNIYIERSLRPLFRIIIVLFQQKESFRLRSYVTKPNFECSIQLNLIHAKNFVFLQRKVLVTWLFSGQLKEIT